MRIILDKFQVPPAHYQRILDYIKPDHVHVMVEGRIVQSGGSEVALSLEEEGYKSWQQHEARTTAGIGPAV